MKPVAKSESGRHDPSTSGQRLLESWEQISSGTWNTQAVPELFACARELSQPARNQSGRDIAGLAADLETYLSAFVDSGLVPNESQRRRVSEMIEQLSEFLDLNKEAAPRTPVKAATHPTRPGRIWTLMRLDNPVPDLLPLLRICGFDARRFDTLEEIDAALDGNPPGVILLDSQYLPAVPRLKDRLDSCVTQIALLSMERDPYQRLTSVQQGVDICFQPPLSTCEVALALSRLIHGDSDLIAQVTVVNPDRTEASFVASVLTTRGLKVKVEHDLQPAFDEILKQPPDLVVLSTAFSQPADLILSTLREEHQLRSVPIVILDADGSAARETAMSLLKAGADEVLATPLDAQRLLETVEVRLERARHVIPHGRRPTVRNLLYQIAVITSEATASNRAVMVMRVVPESPLDSAAAEILDSQAEMMLTLFAGNDRPLMLGRHKLAALVQGDEQGGLDARLHRLLRAFDNQRFLVSDHMISASVHIGVCPLQGHSGSPEQSIDLADRLSLESEESGESGVRTASESGTAPPGCEGVVDAVMSSGLNHRNSVLRFYPLLDDENQASGLYLATLALHVRGTLRPRFDWHEFMPYLQRTGRAIELDQFLFQRVLDTLVADRWDGPSPTVLLPLSAAAFADPSFPTWVATKLKHSGIAPSSMVLSFETSGLVDSAMEAADKLQELDALGLKAGVCGFGTDMVAIELIRRLPMSCVIFDRAFAHWIGRSEEVDGTMQLLLSKLDACDALTVGVNIDDERARERMHDLGLDLLCGDAVAPPMGRPVN